MICRVLVCDDVLSPESLSWECVMPMVIFEFGANGTLPFRLCVDRYFCLVANYERDSNAILGRFHCHEVQLQMIHFSSTSNRTNRGTGSTRMPRCTPGNKYLWKGYLAV